MYYFITSREDVNTSAIELAQVKRLQLFDYLHQPAKIIEMMPNNDHHRAAKKLGTTGRVINLFQYFQQLPTNPDSDDRELVKQILSQPGYQVQGNQAIYNGKIRIKVNQQATGQLNYVDYLDRWGFTDRRDFYDGGCLSYTEFFEDRARLLVRQYYDGNGQVKLTYYYRGGNNNIPILTLIQLQENEQTIFFDTEEQLRAMFLDRLVEQDPQAVLISDRSNVAIKPFSLMQHSVPRYQVFHSAFTVDGQANSQISTVYQNFTQLYQEGKLNGLISATAKEARDVQQRFQIPNSYGIPVTYLQDEELTRQIPFDQRKVGQLIAVARLTSVKRLDHIINTVVKLHKKFPFVDLKIYGYADSWDNYQTSNALRKLVQDRFASSYVHFAGYQDDLTNIYQTAQIEILTSNYEGFAMALLEAQGNACPVVSYDINYGPADIIDDGVSGCLVPQGDVQTLYDVLADLLAHPVKLREYSAHAQAAVAKYSFVNVAKSWQNFITQEGL